MVRPPLTLSTWPVMKSASGEAKNAIAPTTSSGVPSRRKGIARQGVDDFLAPGEGFAHQRGIGRPGAYHVDVDMVARQLAREWRRSHKSRSVDHIKPDRPWGSLAGLIGGWAARLVNHAHTCPLKAPANGHQRPQ
jgi:hypothetical protein